MKNKNKNKKPQRNSSSELWLYGKHAVFAAIKNPKREVLRILATKTGADYLKREFGSKVRFENIEAAKLSHYAPADVPNQGLVALVNRLKDNDISIVKNADLVMVLDQVTDPHNIGAILRSAAAFGVAAIIMHEHNCPSETPSMAKSASGAVEIVPIIRVGNLSKSMDELKNCGFWFIGMDGAADISLKDAPKYDRIAIVMGAEGKGLRRLTAEKCDLLVKLPIKNTVESLNVSNAAAIALYSLS